MPLRDNRRRVDVDAEIYLEAQRHANALKVSTAWLIGQLVADGLAGHGGTATELVAGLKRKEAAARTIEASNPPSVASAAVSSPRFHQNQKRRKGR